MAASIPELATAKVWGWLKLALGYVIAALVHWAAAGGHIPPGLFPASWTPVILALTAIIGLLDKSHGTAAVANASPAGAQAVAAQVAAK